MNKQLVVVESPAKARTISRFVGPGVSVMASMGHIRDLPKHELGVDIAADFKPVYELTQNGKKVIRNLRAAAANAEEIYLATDPDREGEAIAWHLQAVLQNTSKGRFHRISFHEITKSAIDNSFAQPGIIAENLVNAQQARRVLDRLVGYQVSPLLWKSIRKGTSAGRVQSVALRLIVEREREIKAFQPEEYWNLDAIFTTQDQKVELKTRLARLNGEKAVVSNAETAEALAEALQGADVCHQVAKVTSTPRRQKAPPPFITSTLQQAAGSFLKFGTSQTMRVAQALYEGVDLGPTGSIGLITYMRTDSFSIAKEAQQQAAAFVSKNFGSEYLPAKPNFYRSRKSAQEAHEAIRPTDINRTPDSLSTYLTPQQLKLYRLIWNRFLASQMSVAKQLDHAIEIESSQGPLASLTLPTTDEKKKSNTGVICSFRAAARETIFPGYLAVYNIKDLGDEDDLDNHTGKLPALTPGLQCSLLKLLTEQCFTSPPSRFSEASLVKALEQNDVGRPSTFAAIVNTILDREYVLKEKSSLAPTELGFSVNDFLVGKMPDLFNVGFTAEMENALDKIEEGTLDWTTMLRKFYDQLYNWLGPNQLLIPLVKPTLAKLNALLSKLFPEGFVFDAPLGKGQRIYEDGKFVTSIQQRAAEKKDLTERQWNALLNTMGKYASRDDKFMHILEEAGLGEQIRQAIQVSESKPKKEPQELDPQLAALLSAISKVTFEKAVKRNRRVYDDGKFFRSLKRQAENDGTLSPAQLSALVRLAQKYSTQINEYETFKDFLGQLESKPAAAADAETSAAADGSEGAAQAATTPDPAQQARCQALLAMTTEITTWRPAATKGKRVFNDKDFTQSLQMQFEQKGSLSDRQLSALGKMLGKYAKQIDNYQERSQELGIGATAPVMLEEKCPQCGAPLVQRMGRGRPFVGCSAFPKCRYIALAK